VSISGTPTLAQGNDAPAPRSLAILPTVNKTDRPELSSMVREALYRGLAPLPYQDRELAQVDAFLSQLAIERGTPPDQLPLEAMTDPKLADCVVYSQLTSVSRFYLLLYSHVTVELDFMMVDTRTRVKLYLNHFVIRDRQMNPFISLPGLLESSLFTLWHLRPDEFKKAVDDGAENIAKQLPAPHYDLAAGPTLRLTEAEVSIDRLILREGDRITVKAKGTANCRSTFSIGKLAKDQPLVETTPGIYSGVYEVKNGDNAPYAVVEIQLQLPNNGESIAYPIANHSFAIDTTPPPRGRIVQSSSVPGERGIYLDLSPIRLLPLGHDDEKYTYVVYRRTAGESAFQKIGETEAPNYHDATMDPSKVYEYFLILIDKAGNVGSHGPVFKYDPMHR